MWHLTNIPKVVHFYFGGKKMSYLRYLTIKTFAEQNPEWHIKYYYPTEANPVESWDTFEQKYDDNWDDYTPQILNNKSIVHTQVDFSSLGADNKMSEVHKSDYLRWILLASGGGLWSDMDIIFYKSIDEMLVNIPENSNAKSVVCISDYGHSIGFLLSCANNQDFKRIEQSSMQSYLHHSYQCMGSMLFNRLFPTIESMDSALNLPMHTVYPLNANQTRLIFNNSAFAYKKGNIGLHWYAGSKQAGEFLNQTNGGKEQLPNILISKVIRQYG